MQGGGGEVAVDEESSLEDLALTLLRRVGEAASSAADRRTAADALSQLDGRLGEEMGVRSATARALAALARLQWFAPLGVFTAQRFVRSLSQVVRYLNEPGMREKVQARVGGHVTADTVL